MQNEIRTTIKRMISSLEPLDALEQEHISFVQHWLSTAKEIFRIIKPSTPDMHLVSYFVLFDPIEEKILLSDHKKSGLWLPTGGHIEPGEHPWTTVEREAIEELGIPAIPLFEAPLFLSVTKTSKIVEEHTDISLWYVLKGNVHQELNFSREEFHTVQWFSIDEIPYHCSDQHMHRFVTKLALKTNIKTLI